MTQWPSEFVSFSQAIDVILGLNYVDSLTGATLLDDVKTQLMLGTQINDIILEPVSQLWINFGFLLGGIYLLLRRIIFWQIPFSLLLGLTLMSAALFFIDPSQFNSPSFHLANGATMLAAFFIATDPVSASTTPRGRVIYGFFIGILIVVIRVFGGYPDAVAFAVLLLILWIDFYSKMKQRL